jgi:hypothetical protein
LLFDDGAVSFLTCPQPLFGQLTLGDVDARANVPGKGAFWSHAGNARIDHPTVLPIRPPQAIFHREGLARLEGGLVSVEAMRNILRVHPFCPTIAHLLHHRSAGKIQPRFVEEGTTSVSTRHPDDDGRRIGHHAEARLAFPQRFLGSLTFLDEDRQDKQGYRDHDEEEL